MIRYPSDAALLNAFVAACPPQDRPHPFSRPAGALAALQVELPGALPPLFGDMLIRYKWGEIDLGTLRFLPSHGGVDLSGWLGAARQDRALREALFPAGYIPFARAPEYNYDPICFDLHQRESDGDCRIVRFDHEEILCNYRLREVATLAPSFRALIEGIIEAAKFDSGSTIGR